MTTSEACDLIVTLTAELRDEKALRANLEEDLRTYRELVTILLTELHDWQLNPRVQERRHQQFSRDRCAALMAVLMTDAA